MTIGSSSSSNGLSSYFINLINNIMTVESQPLQNLQTQKTTINTQRSVYSTLQTKMGDLKDSLQNLMSSSPFASLKLGRSTSVGNVSSSGATVISGSADSTASVGDYNIFVNQLATAQQRVSAVQTSPNQSLGSDWHFYLGGQASASAAVDPQIPAGRVSNAGVSDVVAGYQALGSDAYTVETQTGSDGNLQVRLRDSDGNLVGIGKDNSTDWQTVTPDTGGNLTFDTQRGLKITFNDTGKLTDSAKINFIAKGTEIDVSASDSLVDIAQKINSAAQSDTNGVTATVVGSQMILTNTHTGTGHDMIYSSELAQHLGFTNSDLTTAQDAQFTVNGLPVTQPGDDPAYFTSKTNSGITNAISGVTLNFANDAAKKSATLTVNSTTTDAVASVNTFISKFNDMQTYLGTQTAVTKTGDNTYSRGPLADDSMFIGFRTDMFSIFMQPIATTGSLKSLSDVGLTIDDNLQVSISDQSKLNDALQNHPADLQSLFNGVMKSLDDQLSIYTGSSGYLPGAIKSYDSEITDIGLDITDLTDRLNARQSSLVNQYANLQTQLQMMQYQQQMWSQIFSTTSSSG